MEATAAVGKPRKATPKEQIEFLLAEVRALRAENASLRSAQPEHPLRKALREKQEHAHALHQEKADLEMRKNLGLPLPTVPTSPASARAPAPNSLLNLKSEVKKKILAILLVTPDLTDQEIREELDRDGFTEAKATRSDTISKVRKMMREARMRVP